MNLQKIEYKIARQAMLGGTVVRINKKWDEEENEYEEIQKSINNI